MNAHVQTGYAADMATLHSLDAEKDLLGCLLFSEPPPHQYAVWPQVEGRVRADQFRSEVHQKLFRHVAKAHGAGQMVALAALHEQLKDNRDYLAYGGMSYLADLVDRAPPAYVAGELADLIASLDARRRLVAVAHAILADAKSMEGAGGVDSVIARSEALIADVQKATTGGDAWVDGAGLSSRIEDRLAGRSRPSYVTTGFAGLDLAIGGFRKARMTIIAGRPSMGKSAVAVEIMRAMALQGLAVGMFSLEMDEDELAVRMGCGAVYDYGRHGNPVYFDADRDQLDDAGREALWRGGQILRDLPIFFDCREKATPAQIVAGSKRLIRKCERQGLKMGALLIDHLHIVNPDEPSGNRVVDVGAISQDMASLAKSTGVPVIALCQLSRQVESRQNHDKRPQMSDLRWSGEIEQDAASINFIYRPEYYLREPEDHSDHNAMIKYEEDKAKWANKIMFLNEKNRGGPRGAQHVMNISLPHNALWEGV
ncbi:DnaB-like helicase C-terminal domain-containing protein [Asticcacaulis sp. ZE23SCel15]|uniref:replicative DNA helicase n=1 Tax=Asticcacaulis sp. ZE23SCel15 TaxID=3059027 RepID=UPI0026601EC4|nr:DnaB-like helicase C-terminal domain-containing protein [Asticcacaulis sp. ZE23SCel15]WKL57254.1 DnaB-like helicase C-terminal domain-containing protein [Asticcacaulis sp. ZE23SCel15]